MRIVIANNFYYCRGGSERILFEEKRVLEENGHHVIPFSRMDPKNECSDYVCYFPRYLSYEFEKLSLLKKVYTTLNIIYDRDAGSRFAELLEKTQSDLIHAHNIYGRLTTSLLDSAQKKGVPVIMTLHDYKLICPSYLTLNRGHLCEDCQGGRFYHCLLNRCHKNSLVASAIYTAESYYNKWLRKYDSLRFLICPSRFLQSKLLSNGFSAERLIYLPNFLNLTGFTPSYDAGDYLLYVGRLSKEKGIMTLLKAVEKLDVPVKIVGDGPMKAEFMAFIRENKISHVTFMGYKSGEDLKQLYENAAFLVIPSEWYENAPMTILEAYAYGKPVIGSRIGGIPEMIDHEKTGMLFTMGDAGRLAECIENLWSNKSVCRQMGHAARNKVEREYSSELHYEHLMELYRNLLN